MKTLFILSSKLQVFHANHFLQARNISAEDCLVVFIRSTRERDNQLTQEILSQTPWRIYSFSPPMFSLKRSTGKSFLSFFKKIFFDVWNELGIFGARLKFALAVKLFFIRAGTSFSTVVLGDYRPLNNRQFFRYLKMDATDFVLLDDGSITPEVMKYRFDGSCKSEIFSKAAINNYSLLLPDPFIYKDPPSLTYFTIYRRNISPADSIEENTFYKKFNEESSQEISDEVWICGTDHVETKICHLLTYMKMINSALSLFPEKKYVYLAHRRERQSKIKLLSRNKKIALCKSDKCFEEILIDSEKLPCAVISFGSTTLDTASIMLRGRSECILIVPPKNYFQGKRDEHITSVLHGNARNTADVVSLFADDPYRSTRYSLLHVDRPDSAISVQHMKRFEVSANRENCRLIGVKERERPFSILPETFTPLFETARKNFHCLAFPLENIGDKTFSFIHLAFASEGVRNFEAAFCNKKGNPGAARFSWNFESATGGLIQDKHRTMVAAVSFSDDNICHVKFLAYSDTLLTDTFLGVFLKKDAASALSYMGDRDFGIALAPESEYSGGKSVLFRQEKYVLLQINPGSDGLPIIRFYIHNIPVDVLITKLYKKKMRIDTIEKQKMFILHCNTQTISEVLHNTAAITLLLSESELTITSNSDSIVINLSDYVEDKYISIHDITVDIADPYTGERRIIEIGIAGSQLDPGRQYVTGI